MFVSGKNWEFHIYICNGTVKSPETEGPAPLLSWCSLWWWWWPAVWRPWRCHTHTGWPAVWPAGCPWVGCSRREGSSCILTAVGRHWMSVSKGKSSPCQTWVSKQKTQPLAMKCREDIREGEQTFFWKQLQLLPSESSFVRHLSMRAQSAASFATAGGCEMPECSNSKVKMRAVSFY